MFDIDSVSLLTRTPGCNSSLRSNKSVPTYVYFQIDLEKLEDVRNRVKVKKRQRQKYD